MIDWEDVGESPIFLVGAERSMTTLLRLMFDHHPQLAWHEEFEFAVDFMPEEGWPDLNDYHDWLSVHRIFLAAGHTIDPNLSYPELVQSFLEQRRKKVGKPLIGATCHRHYDRLLRIWPNARFIHTIRDGRDVAKSYFRLGWAGNVWMAAKVWLEAEELWDKTQAKLREGQWTELRTKTLLENPEGALSGICDFIGIPFDSAMLDYPSDTTYKRPDAALLHQWKRKASKREVQLIEARIGSMLQKRGYELSGYPLLKITKAMELGLWLHHRANRVRFRKNNVGGRLMVEDFLARRLGPRIWARKTQLQINEKLASRIRH